ncbi:hypothetical protein ATO12_12735 [Aquimarina atlantica]|uniref:Uncharacterized protein n=1 Tax=Aquimarina atlantica TaxID=1317122 RepID=A0A023BX51_9FLAO|nr:hypothetical protein [Aquimarina atlantica]EZH74626.1 hypothetical protein ATO12_12735 [Aquimarina atlantica]
MNLCKRDILAFFKSLTILVVLLAVFIQPLAETMSFLADSSYELVHVDDEENIEKEEQQKDGKNELQILDLHNHLLEHGMGFSIYSSPNMYSNLYIEILIPPPDVA